MQALRHTRDPARIRISACVTNMLNLQPFFGSLALNLMPPIPDRNVADIATDGAHLWYNPDWVVETQSSTIQAAIAHCVFACALKHHTRRGPERDYDRWQIASHLVTTPIRRNHGLDSPEDGSGLDMSVEKAYELVPSSPKEGNALAPRTGEGPDSSGQGQQQDQSQDGSGNSQNPGQGNTGQPSRMPGEIMDSPEGPNSKAEEQRWDQKIHQSMRFAKTQGDMPGDVEDTIDASLNRRMEWRDLLQEFMLDSAQADRNWATPNHRFIAEGTYLPGIHSRNIECICFAIDVSGSLDPEELAMIWGQIRDCTEMISPEYVRVIQCDYVIQQDNAYGGTDLPDRLETVRGGGTSYLPVFELLEQDPPEFLIYMTDLQCDRYPKPEPEYPVLWVCTSPETGPELDPPFGERIDIPAEQ